MGAKAGLDGSHLYTTFQPLENDAPKTSKHWKSTRYDDICFCVPFCHPFAILPSVELMHAAPK
jgi:hypothetical protein